VHDRDPVGEAHGLDLVVGDVDRGGLALLEQALELGPHLQPQERVEVGERLVHEQHLRPDRERPGHRHPLPLPARELARELRELALDVHERRRALHLAPDRGLVHPLLHAQAEGDVLEHRHVREDGVVLEHHRDVARAGRQAVHPPFADPDPAVGLGLQAGDDAQEGGLAAARRAQQDGELPVLHVERDGLERLEPAEGLAHVLDADAGHGSSTPERLIPAG
jgi:hypothetical protein